MIQKFSFFLLLSIIVISCDQDKSTSATSEKTLFRLVDNATSGIEFSNDVQISQLLNAFTYKYVYNGGGLASADLDGDDLPELIFTSNQNGIQLYKNLGNLKFEKVENSGMTTENLWLTGVTVTDVNNDGLIDVYVCASGVFDKTTNHLFINKGNLQFEDQAAELGVADRGRSTQAVFFDADRDGDQDLYVSNHPLDFNASMDLFIEKSKNPDYRDQDRLYVNDNGQFKDITQQAGLANYGFSLSAAIADLNDDGWLDIYVANDFHTPDHYFINNGDLTFRDELKSTFAHVSNFSMGTDVADLNNDGLLDLIELDMVSADPRRKKTQMPSMAPEAFWFTVDFGYHYQYMTNVLQLNNGTGKFSDIAKLAGVSSSDWSWGPILTDLDGDGWKDIFISNGIRKDVNDQDYSTNLRGKMSMGINIDYALANLQMPEAKIPNFAFQNNGDLTFDKVSPQWGLDYAGFSTSAIATDLDGDGDIDIAVNNIDTLALIFENTLAKSEDFNYIKINTLDQRQQRNTSGNRITTWQQGKMQLIEQTTNRGFQSSQDPTAIFGLSSSTIDSIQVYWYNSGSTTTLQNVTANQTITINQENDEIRLSEKPAVLFADSKEQGLKFQRTENEFDDYAVQILLPHELSSWGYAMAKGDINGDGREDLYLGGASGQSGLIYQQMANGNFRKRTMPAITSDKDHEDYDAIWLDANGDGLDDLYVVSGGYELDQAEWYRDRLYLNTPAGLLQPAIYTPNNHSGGSVAAVDIDGDGTLEIMTGGRYTPAKYPLSDPTAIYTLVNGQLEDRTDQYLSTTLGIVNDITIADMDNDGDQDIITAGEWEPIRILYNDGGKLRAEALPNSEGWWFDLNIADFNKDGQLDILGGNLGLNYKYKASAEEPFTVFHDNFDNNKSYDIVLSYFHEGTQRPLRGRQCSSEQLPFIARKFKSYNAFADATIDDMLGDERLASTNKGIAKTFANTVYMNTGPGGFKVSQLPAMAQISAVNASIIEDYDKDGHLDIIMAGNLYASEVETPRSDASIGLLLKGDGQGNFEAVPARRSGISISGWVKDMERMTIGDRNIILFGKDDDLQTVTYSGNED